MDLADSHTVSAIPTGLGYLGALIATVLNPDSTGTGSRQCGLDCLTFRILRSTNLPRARSVVQTYEVTVDDGTLNGALGSSATQLVEITLTGTNDVPVIAGGFFNGGVTELPDLDGGENLITHSTSGPSILWMWM